eukprot:TRINITY_DN2517_c0_g2_i1.p2 TRINITY_DN2517_c0_g2~~TRINITY_DN2517_c0_g2_i1.p2  ORF type:complete len:132 (+),score=10.84 TRINITY_DN2517_c0_g2_i1:607-1002(+)
MRGGNIENSALQQNAVQIKCGTNQINFKFLTKISKQTNVQLKYHDSFDKIQTNFNNKHNVLSNPTKKICKKMLFSQEALQIFYTQCKYCASKNFQVSNGQQWAKQKKNPTKYISLQTCYLNSCAIIGDPNN